MLIAEIRRKLSDLEDLDGDDGDSIGRVRSLLSSSKEDLLTADVFGAVKYLPRRPYLAAVLDGIAQRNQSCPEFACHNAQLHVGEDDFQFNFWPTYRNPTGLPGNMTEPDVELLCPSTRIFVEAKLGAGFGSLQIPRQLLIGLQQDDGREFFLVLGRILSSACGPWIGVVEYGLGERGHLEGAAEAVTEIGEGTYAQLLRCLHQRCKNVHCTDASLAAAV